MASSTRDTRADLQEAIRSVNRRGGPVAEEKLQARPISPRPGKVVVRFDQQQRKLLDFLRKERKFGTEDGEIIRNVVLDYLQQQKRKSKR
jgi:hypothetical protein